MSESVQEHKPNGSAEHLVSTDDAERMLEEARRGQREWQERWENERAQRQRIERERDDFAGRVGTAAERDYANQLRMAEGGFNAASAELARAKQAYAKAREEGNGLAEADALEAINEAMHKRQEAARFKQHLETNKEQLVVRPQVTRADADPYDNIVKDLKPSEREWLQKRPKFLSDERYRQRVFNASGLASENADRGSPEYFREMERILREEPEEHEEPVREERRQRASSDLPPTRRSAPGQKAPAERTVYELTPEEVEAAEYTYGNPSVPEMYLKTPKERYDRYNEMKERLKNRG